jgi:hypothetical protein
MKIEWGSLMIVVCWNMLEWVNVMYVCWYVKLVGVIKWILSMFVAWTMLKYPQDPVLLATTTSLYLHVLRFTPF